MASRTPSYMLSKDEWNARNKASAAGKIAEKNEKARLKKEAEEQAAKLAVEKARQEAEDAAKEQQAAAEKERQEAEYAANAKLAAAEKERQEAAEAARQAALDAAAAVEKARQMVRDAEIAVEAEKKRKEEEKKENQRIALENYNRLVQEESAARQLAKKEVERIEDEKLKAKEAAELAAKKAKDKAVMEEAEEHTAREAARREQGEEKRMRVEITPTARNEGSSVSSGKDSIKVSTASNEMSKDGGFDEQLVPGQKPRRKECPSSIMTDTYKATHLLMYEEAKLMSAYGEFRQAYPGMDDDRIVVYGIKYYIDNFIKRKMDESDLKCGREFLKSHILSERTKQYFTDSKDTYFDLLGKNGGFYPVKIEAMPEGSVVRPHIPVFIVTARNEHSRLCTFLETILTMIWYSCTVATLSRHTRTLIEQAFKDSVDGDESVPKYRNVMLSRLHDFGFRGCTCMEQSVLGGLAHLLSFEGSDTMSACYYGKEILNGGKPIGFSIPASEHSVMTSYESEVEAVKKICNEFGSGLFSVVMDAYDYDVAIDKHLKEVAEIVRKSGGTFVIRPDSGDAVEQVMKALDYGERAFGSTVNSKGYKVLNNCAVLQGDGINYDIVKKILKAVLEEKFSAENVAFGMGGGLLQKVNRDTMSFATKLSLVDERPILKAPAKPKKDKDTEKKEPGSDNAEEDINPKTSLPGKLIVLHEVLGTDVEGKPIIGEHVVYAADVGEKLLNVAGSKYRRSMKVVYDGTRNGREMVANRDGYDDLVNMSEHTDEIRAFEKETFDEVRQRLNREWNLFKPRKPAVDSGLQNFQISEIRKIRDKISQELAKMPSDGTRLGSEFHEASNRLLGLLDSVLS